ncbi:alcohol dehydrogenase [Streptomyces griseocarneus]|nr:alcohol dehydrogenase [Streptomyces griseocarneus]
MSTAVAPDDAQAGAGERVPLPVHRAIVREGGSVRVRRRPTLPPAAGELSIAPLVAGLCGTDLQMLRGLRDDPAPVIGHEGVARVVAAGRGVDSVLAPGALVVVNPTHPTDPSFLLGHNVDGLLQERTLIPATAVQGGQVIALSEAPEPDLAALLEPLATVRYALSVLATARPRTLVVLGDGTVGHLAVRAARHWLGDGVRTVLVHHTRQGREWSARSRIRADVLLTQGLDDAGALAGTFADGPVAVLLATPRDATLTCLETVLRAARGEVTVDLLGGLPPGAGTALLPGVDLAAVRAANCAGLPDPAETVTVRSTTGVPVRLFGHRGVGNAHLLASAAELCRAPERYRDLVTHAVDLTEAAAIMGRLALGRDRNVAGRRLIKLAVRIAPPCRKTLED